MQHSRLNLYHPSVAGHRFLEALSPRQSQERDMRKPFRLGYEMAPLTGLSYGRRNHRP